MRVIDFDFYFVEDTFGPNEKPTVSGVSSPYDGGCTVDLNAQLWGLIESMEKPKVTREDGVFGVFDVEVFVHDPIISTDGSGLG